MMNLERGPDLTSNTTPELEKRVLELEHELVTNRVKEEAMRGALAQYPHPNDTELNATERGRREKLNNLGINLDAETEDRLENQEKFVQIGLDAIKIRKELESIREVAKERESKRLFEKIQSLLKANE